jgi:putative glycosyltransferase
LEWRAVTPSLSIVATLYQSEATVIEFCRRAAEAARAVSADYELVLVNDGSSDASLDRALEAQRLDARITIVDLSRNFGHHHAMLEGLRRARGRLVFLIDSDLEDDPAHLQAFASELERSRADVVYGVQAARKGGAVERVTGAMFYRVFNWLSPVRLQPNIVPMRLMTRRYVTALLQHGEREVFIAGLWAITGFQQVPWQVSRASRRASTYTLARKVDQFVTAVTSFTNRPLILVFYLGVVISSLSAIAIAYLVIRRLLFGGLLAGWPSLIVSVWLLGGLTIAAIGVVGVYLSRVFAEVKQRPRTITRAIYGDRPEDGER